MREKASGVRGAGAGKGLDRFLTHALASWSGVVREACATPVPKVAPVRPMHKVCALASGCVAVAQSFNQHYSERATSTRQGRASRPSVGRLRVYRLPCMA